VTTDNGQTILTIDLDLAEPDIHPTITAAISVAELARRTRASMDEHLLRTLIHEMAGKETCLEWAWTSSFRIAR